MLFILKIIVLSPKLSFYLFTFLLFFPSPFYLLHFVSRLPSVSQIIFFFLSCTSGRNGQTMGQSTWTPEHLFRSDHPRPPIHHVSNALPSPYHGLLFVLLHLPPSCILFFGLIIHVVRKPRFSPLSRASAFSYHLSQLSSVYSISSPIRM